MFNLKCDLSFISLNTRGLKDNVKRKATFLFCKGLKAHAIFLQETHSCKEDEIFWKNQWGEKILFSHGTNRSGGVAICFQRFPGEIITHKGDSDGHWLTVIANLEGSLVLITNIYGYNNLNQNKKLLGEITEVISDYKDTYNIGVTIVGGDFNLTPDEWLDKSPSSYVDHHYNATLKEFTDIHSLADIWRQKNPNECQYTWLKPNGCAKSRIDYWLVSPEIQNFVCKVDIAAAPLTDHCVIELSLKSNINVNHNKSYWKFNCNLLLEEDFVNEVKYNFKKIESEDQLDTYCKKWEYFKFKVRNISIKHGKIRSQRLRVKENILVREINDLCKKQNIADEEKATISNLQSSLDKLFMQRAQGAYVRSRAKWIEQGEKNTSYFYSLEKRRQEKNKINSLIINDKECNQPKIIAEEIYKFYSKLYSSNYSNATSKHFLENIKHNIPQVEQDFQIICDAEIQLKELDNAISHMALGKAPGQDGLTTNFYKFFWNEIKNMLFEVFKECVGNNTLTITMKQGVITLLPKPGKDKRYMDNLRPISLLNVDYKIFTQIMANRLKTGIGNIVSEHQSGFLKDRSIHNNIRLVLDLLDYRDLIDDPGFILFLDFYKAFDCVEHPFILKTLEFFGFGTKFIEMIKMMYTDITSSVALPGGTTPRFQINRGVKQGCPCSPSLFILVAEILSIYIKNSLELKPLNVLGKSLIITQLADDTTIFVKNGEQIPIAIEKVENFSKASGLKLNIKKCELMALQEYPNAELHGIPVKSEIKYLGIVLSKDWKKERY